MASLSVARNHVRKLHALSTDLIKERAVGRLLRKLGPMNGAQFIDELLLLARQGWEPARCVLANTLNLLLNDGELVNDFGMKRLACLQQLAQVEALFTHGRAIKEYDPGAAAKVDAKLFSDSLGHLKEKARRTVNPDELARLVQLSSPSVVRNVLLNPRITEEIVVRMAARRPARPEPLLEIWRSTRWSSRIAVRRALAFNPYLPLEVGCKIVPLLRTSDLKELAQDRSIHSALREQAFRLLHADSDTAPRPAQAGD